MSNQPPYAIGIDLGGTRVKLGLVRDGRVIASRMVPANADGGLRGSLPVLEREIEVLRNGVDLAGIGMAFAGLADPVSKRILSTNQKYDDAKEMDLEGWVRQRWGVPFFIDNDARMAAVGEWKYGAGKDTNDLVMMTIGTGIGSSAVIGGQVLRGRHFQAGCLGGHFSVRYDGLHCTCGNRGCAEAYGGTWSLRERLGKDWQRSHGINDGDPIGFAELFASSDRGDADAKLVLREYMEVWAAAIVNLIHAYDPEVVVIGGGVMERAADILPYVTELVNRHAWTPWGTVSIRARGLADHAGILGVVHCLIDEIKN